jgi:hypothetical protein
VARCGLFQTALELAVTRQKLAPARGQPHAAAGIAAGRALHELEAGRFLELAQIAPRISIGHAQLRRGLAERPPLVDQLEEARSSVAELELFSEDDPDPQLRLHRPSL